MKTVNYIGLRETAAIMYVANNDGAHNFMLVEEFLIRAKDRFGNGKNNVHWHNWILQIEYFLWR